MGAKKLLPDNRTLVNWVERGYSHDEITRLVYEETGNQVSRGAIAAALSRAGLTEVRPRYEIEVPWKVKAKHQQATAVRMLRNLGRVRAGGTLSVDEQKKFDSWVTRMEDDNLVVAYDPESEPGFFYVTADQPGDYPDGTPIRPGFTKFPA